MEYKTFADIQAQNSLASQKQGNALANMQPGRGGVASMYQLGGMLGGQVMGAMGQYSPEEEKAMGIESILSKYSGPPKTMQEAQGMANELHSANYTEEATSLLAEFQKREKDLVKPETDAERKLLASLIKKYGEQEGSKRFLDSTKTSIKGNAQKNVEFFAEINKCPALQSGSPEYTKCMRRSIQDAEDYKRVGEVEFGNKQGIKNFQTAVGDSLKNQTHIRKQISTLKNLKRLTPQIYTGLGQSGVAAWNKVGTMLGVGKATDAQAATEAFRSNGLEIAMGFIHNTKGAVSDMEMAKFIEASPNLHNTEKGNLLIINFAIAQQDLEKKLNVEMNRFSRSNRSATMADWNFHADSFLNRPENSISNQLQKDFDDAFSDPAYGGGTGVDTDTGTDASQDIQSQIDALR